MRFLSGVGEEHSISITTECCLRRQLSMWALDNKTALYNLEESYSMVQIADLDNQHSDTADVSANILKNVYSFHHHLAILSLQTCKTFFILQNMEDILNNISDRTTACPFKSSFKVSLEGPLCKGVTLFWEVGGRHKIGGNVLDLNLITSWC